DRTAGTVRGRPGTALAIYASGGVIPNRGTYTARVAGQGGDGGGVVAELDEEFVFEARLGQVFAVGGQGWRIERITPAEVLVSPVSAQGAPPPFWHGDQRSWDDHFAARVGDFFAWAEKRLSGGTGPDDPDLLADLRRTYFLEPHAARALVAALDTQRRVTGASLPHQGHILVERTATGPGGNPGRQIILHMPFGLRVNRTMALALEAAFAARLGQEVFTHAANEGVAVVCPDDPEGADAANILFLVPPSGVEGMLRERLEGSQEFAAAFREAAWRSLVLGRAKIGRRMPLWITRLKSQKLFSAVKDLEDFPLIIEAWRTCLTERFDAPGLSRVLRGLAGGEIAWSVADTAMQSPLARDMVWRVVAGFMYAGDRSTVAAATRVSPDLVAEAVADAGLRPVAPAQAAVRLGALVRRTAPGYAPGSGGELLQYVLERLAVPLSEWNELGDAVARDHGLSLSGLEEALPGRLVRFRPPHAAPDAEALVVAAENLPRLESALAPDEDGGPSVACLEVVAEWLRFYGPVDSGFAAETLGLDPGRGREVVSALVRDGTLVLGRLVSGGGDADVCDTANFERLLRLARTGNAPRVPSVSMARLTPYLAAFQGLSPRGKSAEELFERLRRLTCLPLPAAAWEEEVLPARCQGYEPAFLDEVLRHAGLVWRGGGLGRVLFVFAGDQDLLDAGTRDAQKQDGDAGPKTPDADIAAGGSEAPTSAASGPVDDLFPDPLAAYDFSAILRRTGLRPGEAMQRLWAAVWQGGATNESFEALRQGLATNFRLPELGGGPVEGLAGPGGRAALPRSGRTRVGRGRLAAWRSAMPQVGLWRRVEPAPRPGDELEEHERDRERARLLLDRYGVVFRELLVRESDQFSWGGVFRALRLLELSGEVVSGRFFDGPEGIQFASRRGVAVFRRLFGGREPGAPVGGAPAGDMVWMSALDPAAPLASGLALPGRDVPRRPPRRAGGTHLVFRGGELVFVSEGYGRDLFIGPEPEEEGIGHVFAPLSHLLSRRVRPLRRLAVAGVNGRPAATSPYLPALARVFQVTADHKGVNLYPRSA
ncbi:MAG: ATP-dependent helicase, partial [Desulfovibrio sp.]|nr:ATP-dependent helicase [Desulfovibrio sp.]